MGSQGRELYSLGIVPEREEQHSSVLVVNEEKAELSHKKKDWWRNSR